MSLYNRGKQILKEKGFLSLLRWALLFPARLLLKFENFYVYVNDLGEIPDVSCKVENLILRQIFLPITLAEYEQLGRDGVDISPSRSCPSSLVITTKRRPACLMWV